MRMCSIFTIYKMPLSLKSVVLLLSILFLCSCAKQSQRPSDLQSSYLHDDNELGTCAELFSDLDDLVSEAGASDVQAARVAGFPYLRTNRFLATFAQVLTAEQVPTWLGQMRKLDREACHFELQNIPVIETNNNNESDIEKRLNDCADMLLKADLQAVDQIREIRQVAKVPDSYIQGNRILGLYPLSRLFVRNGVNRLQQRLKQTFSLTKDALAIRGQLVAHVPEEGPFMREADIAHLLRASSQNSLSIPVLTKADQNNLFNYFAPVWNLDVLGDDDIIGEPMWSAKGKLRVETKIRKVYKYLSYVRVKDQILPQFNYIIWFPSRPATSSFDILSGNIDGITWRVTVDLDGKVLMYDAMHNCGCYHMFFPPAGVDVQILEKENGEEPLLVPQQAPVMEQGDRIHIRIASGSHYIEAVTARSVRPGSTKYRFADYNELRSLNIGNGKRRSMFGINGIIPGTSRKERWLLWPMGVEDAGAMRQWGHHATAFVGRRHFDDPDLLERYFSFP